MINRICILAFLLPFFCLSQTLTGKIIDKETQQPLETVSVYFDNTTVGTTTNSNGDFSIDYTDAIRSPLVISYLGYDRVIITDYRSKKNITVALEPVSVLLDAVHVDNADGLSRRQKLNLFRREFLGTSKFGKSCKILNEDALILKYDRQSKSLYASASVPIVVENNDLQYQISYDIIDFEINFSYVNIRTREFLTNTATYIGTSFYKNLKKSHRKFAIKNREKAYKGSVQHFMRSLFDKRLDQEGYWVFKKGFRINAYEAFTVLDLKDNQDFKSVKLNTKVSILFDNNAQSEMFIDVKEFYVDRYGNYTPIKGVFFSGFMGNQRVGDALPLDYGLE